VDAARCWKEKSHEGFLIATHSPSVTLALARVKNPTDTKNYAAKQSWQSTDRAAAYRASRAPTKYTRYHREDGIITGWLGELPRGATVLDCPCGTGRLLPVFARQGLRYVGADFSCAMIEEAQQAVGETAALGFVNADAERMPFRDNAVDCVVLWRFFHHLPSPDTREAILREAARVTRRQVLVSFYHPLSFTAARRSVERAFGRKGYGQAVTHWRLKAEAEQCGLRVVEFRSYRKYVSINWFAHLCKAG
jgi:ubiquinone/menaquinone biosynthesis C-methylase UbiE